MKKIAFLLIAGLLAAGCEDKNVVVHHTKPPNCVSFQFGSGKYIFLDDITIDQQPAGLWVMDTGASIHVISESILSALGDDYTRTNINVNGVSGTQQSSYINLKNFQVGEEVIHDSRAAVQDVMGLVDNAPVSILGDSYFGQKIVEIDYQNNEICFHRSEESLSTDGARHQFTFEYDKGGHPVVDFRLNGVEAKWIMDTGAGQGVLINSELVHQAQLEVNPKAQTKITGFGNKPITATALYIPELDIHGASFDLVAGFKIDMKPFEEILGMGTPAMNFSPTLLTDKKLVLDYLNQKVYLW